MVTNALRTTPDTLSDNASACAVNKSAGRRQPKKPDAQLHGNAGSIGANRAVVGTNTEAGT
ncbi:hypothetical protein A4X20_29445 [Mycolicibacterium iranicum]|uniref:Uncharacterized protein n=2 Tax=Mycolicibacterium TaxID=1866885 RepID=A0A0M2JV30_9MYCO|nr:hypothetical protein WN67_28070 [Mycolicibacterium obuense]OAN30699.1 hypothetical protein A4X20_29445 [Mycolicibacterium iranicum]